MDSRLDGASLGLAVKDDVHAGRDDGTWRRNVVIDRVEAGGAANKAGLQRGDVVTRAGDVAVNSTLDLQRGFLEHVAGDRVPLVVRRNGVEQKTELVLEAVRTGVAAAAAADDPVWQRLGLRLRIAPADSVGHNNPQLHGGLSVIDVRADGPAGKAGIQRGDILVGLHQWEMLTPGQRALRPEQPRPGHVQPDAVLHRPQRQGPPRHGHGGMTRPTRPPLLPGPRPLPWAGAISGSGRRRRRPADEGFSARQSRFRSWQGAIRGP